MQGALPSGTRSRAGPSSAGGKRVRDGYTGDMDQVDYLDEAEQAQIILGFETSMNKTRSTWMRILALLSTLLGLGTWISFVGDYPVLNSLLHSTTIIGRTGSYAKEITEIRIIVMSTILSFWLPGVAFLTKKHMHLFFKAGALIPLTALVLIYVWSQGERIVMMLLIPLGYQAFCYASLHILNEPLGSLEALKSARYHHKKA